MKVHVVAGLLGVAGALFFSPLASAVDADAAKTMAKKEGCLKCHGLDKKKEATSLTDIAAKFSGKADAVEKILHQITAGETVKFDDGTEESHKVIKTKDTDKINNMIAWILSLKK